MDIRDCIVETSININFPASRRASSPIDMAAVLEFLAHLFLLLIFLLFSDYLSDLVLTDVYMCLNPECEIDPLIEVENDGESQEQSAQRCQK